MKLRENTFLQNVISLTLGVGLGIGGTVLVNTQESLFAKKAPEDPTQEQPAEAALTTPLLLENEQVMGSEQAPLTIVGFSDFECEYCRRFHELVMPELKAKYIDKGLVRFIYKDLPLPFHRQARPAAAAARCAIEQNSYWDMVDTLFNQQNCLDCKGVVDIAEELNLDTQALGACMQQEKTQHLINASLSEAGLHNIQATPTFVIGPTRSDGKLDGDVVEGALPWPAFKSLLDEQLKMQQQS